MVDRGSLDEVPFDAFGGFQRLNRVFGGQLENVIGDVADGRFWRQAA